MRFVLVSLILFSGIAISENTLSNASTSFESNYHLLEKKIEELKSQGQKISEDSRKEIDALLVQMNHEHEQLKHELEKRDRQLKAAALDAKDTKEDWMKRMRAAYSELSTGAIRAWQKLKSGDN